MPSQIQTRNRSAVDRFVEAVAALPLPNDDAANRWNLRTATVAWLRSYDSVHTPAAYFQDLAGWLAWCEATGLDPRTARRGDIDAYASDKLATFSAPTRNRHISALSSWYDYLISNDVTTGNPAKVVKRAKVNADASPTVGLTSNEVTRFIRAARAATGRNARRDAAILAMLAELGMRVGEVLALDFGSFGHDRGHRTVRIEGKGGKFRRNPITAPLGRDLDDYFAERANAAGVPVEQLSGLVFVTATGRAVDQPSVFRLVRRTARAAGLPGADQLSPHSLRHTFTTAGLDAGVPLRDMQDHVGHADPRTTRRYDRNRENLDRSPAYRIANLFAHGDGGTT